MRVEQPIRKFAHNPSIDEIKQNRLDWMSYAANLEKEAAALVAQLQDSTDHMCWLNAQRIMAEKRAEDAEARLRAIE